MDVKEKNHIIKHCIEYCLHRVKKHGGAGIEKIVSKRRLEGLLKKFQKK